MTPLAEIIALWKPARAAARYTGADLADLRRAEIPIADRASWLKLRSRDLTASRIAALFDMHPFLTRAGLAAQLRGTGRSHDNAPMRAGRILEPGVAVAIGEARPAWKLVKATSYHRLPDQRIGATPDYFLDADGVIEITTISPAEWRGSPPAYKIIQTLVQMMVTGRRRGYVAVMLRTLPELPLHMFEIFPHPAAEQTMLAAAAEWWQAFERGEIAPAAPSGALTFLCKSDDEVAR